MRTIVANRNPVSEEGRPDVKSAPTLQFRPDGDEMLTQFGALCWRHRRGRIEVLLVTSRDTGRWVIPKGWPVPGLDGPGSAAREAWEEAGVRAQGPVVPLGVFTYEKVLRRAADGDQGVPCVVSVHAMAVTQQSKTYPESGQRRRRWFSQAKAARKVDEPELQVLIAGFVPPRRDGGKAGGGKADAGKAGGDKAGGGGGRASPDVQKGADTMADPAG